MAANIPANWERKTDDDGNPYWTDNRTGEWYRINKNNQRERINTMEKITILSDIHHTDCKKEEEIKTNLNALTIINMDKLTQKQKSDIINFMDLTEEKDANTAYQYLLWNKWNISESINNYVIDNQIYDEITPKELSRMNSTEQMLIAQNASKRQYFMSSTNCNDAKIAQKYLSKVNWNTVNAIKNYENDFISKNNKKIKESNSAKQLWNNIKSKTTKNNNNKVNINNIAPKIEDLYRMTTAEQIEIFNNFERMQTANFGVIETKKGPIDCDDDDNEYDEYVGNMSLNEADKLNINDKIDHRDNYGLYREAQIIDKMGKNLKIKYDDDDDDDNNNNNNNNKIFWCNYDREINKLAIYGSIARRQRHRFNDLQIGDYVDINPINIHKGWKYGEIVECHKYSGQIKVKYLYKNKDYQYWAHVDNIDEVALITTKTFNEHNENEDDMDDDMDDIKRDIHSIDVKQWNDRDIIEWITSLENGKYNKYCNVLKDGFNKQMIKGSDLMEMRERDLLDLGILHFGDRKNLYKHLVVLIRSNKERFKNNEYIKKREILIDDDEPEEYCCPISYEIMRDPVILTVSGQTYEREAIEDYIKKEHQDPITLQKAELKHIVPNRILNIIIQKWRKNNM